MLGRVSFFSNYDYIVVVRYAAPKEKRRCFAVALRHGVINLLFEMMNSFNQTDNDRLNNAATGKAAYLYTEDVLLTMNVSKCI